jgi:hypothetical protein
MLLHQRVKQHPMLQPDRRQAEGGFLLVSMGIMILVIAAILGSFAFVSQRDGRFKANYAAGQRLADLAVMAHNYVQTTYYSTSPAFTNVEATPDLMPLIGVPDGFSFQSINGTNFTAEVAGRNQAPMLGTTFKAPSAYIHIAVRLRPGAIRTPTDNIAFLDGASSRSLNRVGIVNQDAVPNPSCNGVFVPVGSLHVNWGPEPTACLDQASILAIFPTTLPGDIIIPAWEVTIARSNDQAMFRFPQPERPDTSTMYTALLMNNNDIAGAKQTRTTDIVAPGVVGVGTAGTPYNTPGNSAYAWQVRQGAAGAPTTATMTQGMTVGSAGSPANLRVSDQHAGSTVGMTINGNVAFTVGGSLNSADTIQTTAGGPGPFTVEADDDVDGNPATNPKAISVDQVGTSTTSTTVQIADLTGNTVGKAVNLTNICDPTDPAAANCGGRISSTQNMKINNANSRLNVTNTLDTLGRPISNSGANMDVFAGQIITEAASGTQVGKPGGGALDWSVGAIEQTFDTATPGAPGAFNAHVIQVQQECDGKACPDYVTTLPGGGL